MENKLYCDMEKDITDFHEKFSNGYEGPPRELPAHLSHFRIKFLREELEEYELAVQAGDLVKQADALLDLIYVALGTKYLQGFPINQIWDLVHQANMKKVRATKVEQSTRGSLFDVVKPVGWTAPDIAIAELLEQRSNK